MATACPQAFLRSVELERRICKRQVYARATVLGGIDVDVLGDVSRRDNDVQKKSADFTVGINSAGPR